MRRRSVRVTLIATAVSAVVICTPEQEATIAVSTDVDDTATNGNCSFRAWR